MRLSEHAVHTWDVAVALDPAAEVAPDAVELLLVQLPMLAGWTGKTDGGPFRLRLRGTEPEADFLLEVADKVALVPWPGEGPAGATADGQVQLPAEALLRLVYGRLDPGHTPAGGDQRGPGAARPGPGGAPGAVTAASPGEPTPLEPPGGLRPGSSVTGPGPAARPGLSLRLSRGPGRPARRPPWRSPRTG